jgi:hypothetical protein
VGCACARLPRHAAGAGSRGARDASRRVRSFTGAFWISLALLQLEGLPSWARLARG